MIMILRADMLPCRNPYLKEVYKGRVKFPTTVTGAYNLLQHIASDISSCTRIQNNRGGSFSRFSRRNKVNNVAFMQKEGKSFIEFFICLERGFMH